MRRTISLISLSTHHTSCKAIDILNIVLKIDPPALDLMIWSLKIDEISFWGVKIRVCFGSIWIHLKLDCSKANHV